MNNPADPYRLSVAGSVDKDLDRLPEKSAAALVEFITGPLLDNPHRIGKPLRAELTGRYSARRGPYRVIYEIDDETRVVRVLHAEHRADVYRRR